MSCAVFDLDGTLIDSAPDIHAGVNRLLASEGVPPLSFQEVRGFIGNGVGVLLQRVMAARGMGHDPERHHRLLERFLIDYETAVDLTRLYPGVEDALRGLAADGWKLGLCTNKPSGPTRAVLEHFGLLPLFGAIFTGDSLPERKPDPKPLFATIAALGGGPTLYVGDSEVDAECAARAGLPLALFTEGYRKTPVTHLPHAFAFDDYTLLRAAAPGLLRG